MSYSTSNPPICVAGSPGGQKLWMYSSADATATVVANGYFSDGYALGMRVGHFVMCYDTNVGDGVIGVVTTATAGGAASIEEYQAVTT